jgi:hypothetical protein
VLAVAAIRWPLLELPLERDEGEYAYAGQLLLQGVPPYAEVYSMKLPGIYAVYALALALFGQTARGIHLGLLAVNAITIVLVFQLGRRLFDAMTGVVAAALFAVLALGVSIHGVIANAEPFVLVFAISGLLLTVRAVDEGSDRKLVAAGLLLGCAVLMKQHGAAFVGMGISWVAIMTPQRQRAARVGALLGAALVPYLIVCAVLAISGGFTRFWFWTVRYALLYGGGLRAGEALSTLWARFAPIVGAAPGLWLLACVGLLAIRRVDASRGRRSFVLLLVAFSALAVLPGFHFRPHYFILTLPACALLVALVARFLGQKLGPFGRIPAIRFGIPLALVLLSAGHSFYVQRVELFGMSPAELSRHMYWPNPFVESVELASWIRDNTEEGDRIAVMGSEPQIFFYSGRRSATGYVYTYAMMEDQPYALQMQEEMIREITVAEPKLILFVRNEYSWLRTENSPTHLFEWLERFVTEYRAVAALRILPGESRFYEGADLADFPREVDNTIVIFRR